MENPNEVDEYRLPYTKFELVHQINDHYLVGVKPERAELLGKCVLK